MKNSMLFLTAFLLFTNSSLASQEIEEEKEDQALSDKSSYKSLSHGSLKEMPQSPLEDIFPTVSKQILKKPSFQNLFSSQKKSAGALASFIEVDATLTQPILHIFDNLFNLLVKMERNSIDALELDYTLSLIFKLGVSLIDDNDVFVKDKMLTSLMKEKTEDLILSPSFERLSKYFVSHLGRDVTYKSLELGEFLEQMVIGSISNKVAQSEKNADKLLFLMSRLITGRMYLDEILEKINFAHASTAGWDGLLQDVLKTDPMAFSQRVDQSFCAPFEKEIDLIQSGDNSEHPSHLRMCLKRIRQEEMAQSLGKDTRDFFERMKNRKKERRPSIHLSAGKSFSLLNHDPNIRSFSIVDRSPSMNEDLPLPSMWSTHSLGCFDGIKKFFCLRPAYQAPSSQTSLLHPKE